MTTKTLYRFKGRAVTGDDSGYYFVRWDRAKKISVVASTRQEATDKAFEMLGDSGQWGWSWRLRWDSFDEEGGDGAESS